VAIVPDLVPKLTGMGLEVLVQPGAGTEAGFPDASYQEKGARLEPDVLASADLLVKVLRPTAEEAGAVKVGAVLVGLLQPYANPEGLQALAARHVTAFALELLPRITRAQSMDALSAMSTVAGYKAVLLAAARLPRFFPLLMTAAGTVTPARVFIIGAGVAGLQAIATARRLGGVVEAYDTRAAVKEQVESLGAKFVDLGLDTQDAEDRGGYARAQTEEFYREQQQRLLRYVAAADVVIPTALVPGRRAPVLITAEMVAAMRPGSVIVDLAAEQGGNCALTVPEQEVVRHGVAILGPTNLASTMPFHASQMYARNVTAFLGNLIKEGQVHLNLDDPILRDTLVTRGGEVVHPRLREWLGLPAPATAGEGPERRNP
jgi:NAD(P) transhydrogenase subunit alpha